MKTVCDVVLTELSSAISQRTQKPYYRFKGVIVGCQEFPILSGLAFDKFISEDVYNELSTLTSDRFDCSVGLSRVASNSRDSDISFNLFINGFPKDEPDESGYVPVVDENDKNK